MISVVFFVYALLGQFVESARVCTKEAGFCVMEDGTDQNSGVIKLNALDGKTVKRQENCLKLCLATPGVTGCEVIWDQGNRGCYAHTKSVSRGNGYARHMCWICNIDPSLMCKKETGFCVMQDGRDQNSGVIKLNSLDGNTSKRQEDCLKRCIATPGVTGCEVIWNQGNRGCYAHTKSVSRGNGYARHMCWICNIDPSLTCKKETGFCVKQDGRDQNSGVIKLNSLDGNTSKRQEDCLKRCIATPGVTGCEVIWNQGNRGCYAHTKSVSRGNGYARHMCWICSADPAVTCSKEVGFCVKQDGSDQNSGVIKLNSLDGNTARRQEDCLKRCLAISGVTGCEVIWNQGNRGCYAHTRSVSRGNGYARHMCWICTKRKATDDKPGIGANDDWHYCTSSRRCHEGQGDCDRDSDCAAGLICGKDNCQKFNSKAVSTSDCCIHKLKLTPIRRTHWMNSWDGTLSWSAGSNRMITGFYSKHDNVKEDRIWAFYSAAAGGVSCRAQGWHGWANNWDNPLLFVCPNNQAMHSVYSVHDNHKEDRRWKFRCCVVSSNAYLKRGGWTDLRNHWDGRLDFRCKPTEVLAGLKSYHHNHFEDRRWKFHCAELLNKL